MNHVVYVAHEDTSQADTILVGPFTSADAAEACAQRIMDRAHEQGGSCAAMVMDLVPARDWREAADQ